MTIKINDDSIRLRPSAIDGFFGCAFQWGKQHLEGVRSIPNSRAAIGTAVHAAAEAAWTESMAKGDKIANQSMMLDAGMQTFKEEQALGMEYGDGEDEGSCVKEIMLGSECFAEDIMPYAKMPVAVEKRFTVDLDHQLIADISGTVDYITDNTIADLKTSKRKPTMSNYSTQQSIYTYLAQSNGVDVKHNQIQAVVFKKKETEGMILPLEPDIPTAKNLVNIMLDTLDVVLLDVAPIETILRPNPKYMFCSAKFCNFYGKCPATKDC